jgi:hypothetical protein
MVNAFIGSQSSKGPTKVYKNSCDRNIVKLKSRSNIIRHNRRKENIGKGQIQKVEDYFPRGHLKFSIGGQPQFKLAICCMIDTLLHTQ